MGKHDDTKHERWPYPGSSWWRFDFHTHTPASCDYGKGPNRTQLQQIAPEEWLLGFMRAGVDCVAVTDHNSAGWIDRLQSALANLHAYPEYRPLALYPGVEVTANGNIHVLAIFDPECIASDVDRLLGAVGYTGERGKSETAANASPIEVVRKIIEAHALPILAHVDGPAGAWSLPGNSLAPLLDIEGLFAVEVTDSAAARPGVYQQRQNAFTEVLGSDAHHPSGTDGQKRPGSHWTWVKMARPSLEGLKLALLDGDRFSVRRGDEPAAFDSNRLPENFIESIEVADARYMGRGESEILRFSPWFNALVGGRGTGKSTVIHALRLVLQRERELDTTGEDSEPARTFRRFNQVAGSRNDEGALTDKTAIRMTFVRGGTRYRLDWSQTSQYSRVLEQTDDDNWQESDNQAVIPARFPVRLFSQGQIAALSGGRQQALLNLIDEEAELADQHAALSEARQTYLSLRAKARELDQRLQARDSLKVRRADVQSKLKKFEDGHHAAVLKAYQRTSRQKKEVSRQFEAADEMVDRIRRLAAELVPDDVPGALFDKANPQDQWPGAALIQLHQTIATTSQQLEQIADELDRAARKGWDDLSDSHWQAEINKADRNYDALVAELRQQGVNDPSEYGQLVQQRQQLDNQWRELTALADQRQHILEQANTQLDVALQARREISRARAKFLSDGLAGNEYVKINVKPYAQDTLAMETDVRALLGIEDGRFESDILEYGADQEAKGLVAELMRAANADDARTGDSLETCIEQIKQKWYDTCRGENRFGGRLGNYMQRQIEKHSEFLDHLMLWFPEDGLDIRYSQKGDGRDFKSIEQASAGQRAAAMLAFLLARGTEPIVLDQPEDDLDNRLIYSLVVRQLRANKQHRQIITVTHNPNIVVNGDAEMIHALDFRSGQCRVIQEGALQNAAIREEICQVMEGGRDAFTNRYRRLQHKV